MLQPLLRWFKSGPDRPRLESDAEIRRLYGRQRWSVFLSVTLGYGMFYLCRVNFSVVKKPLLDQGLLSATQMGIIGSAMLVVYAVGKLVNGFLADRSNVRRFMAAGLMISALANLVIGFHPAFSVFLGAWAVSGWFQAHGSAPSVVALSQWFAPHERGTRYGLWSVAHSIGEGLTFAGTAVLVSVAGWRWGFWGPGIVCVIAALVLLRTLADRPETLGLPPVNEYSPPPDAAAGGSPPTPAQDSEPAPSDEVAAGSSGAADVADPAAGKSSVASLQLEVLRNPAIWVLGVASACMYVARYGINNWGILYLQSAKEYSLVAAGSVLAANTVTGLAGAATSGWISDRFFNARRTVPLLVYGVLQIAALVAFYLIPPGNQLLDTAAMGVFGFALGGLLVYLGGLMAVDVCSRRAAGAAMGIIGLFSYLGAAIQDGISGWLIDAAKTGVGEGATYSFDNVFTFWIAASCLSLVLAMVATRIRRPVE